MSNDVQKQIDACESAVRTEVDIPKLHAHHARLGGLLARQAIDMGETPEDVVTRTFASLAKESDNGQRRVMEATLAAATAAGAAAPASTPRRATAGKLTPEPSPQPAKSTTDPDKVRCSNRKCGAMSERSAKFCRVCGSRLSSPDDGDDDDDDKRKKPDGDDDDDDREAMLAEGRRRMGLASSRSQETPRVRPLEASAAREPMRFVAEEPAAAAPAPHPESRLGRLHREGASISALEALHASAPRMVRR